MLIGESVLLRETFDLVEGAHAGQSYGNMPYWMHCFTVAEISKFFFGEAFSEMDYAAALLHDIVEDTNLTLADLVRRYDPAVTEVVRLLTKIPDISYEANIARIVASGNLTAMRVKYADNFVNYNGDKSDWEPKRREKSNAKYAKSMQVLASALGFTVDEDFIPEGVGL